MAEMAEAARLVAWVVAKGGHVEDKHIVVIFAMVGQRLLYEARCCSGVAHHDALSVVDGLDGFCGF